MLIDLRIEYFPCLAVTASLTGMFLPLFILLPTPTPMDSGKCLGKEGMIIKTGSSKKIHSVLFQMLIFSFVESQS